MTGPELAQAIRQFTINLLKENHVTVNYSENFNRETETVEWNINVSTNFDYVFNWDGLCEEEGKTKQLSIPQKFDEIMRLFNIVCTTGDMDTMNRYAHDVRVALKALDGKEDAALKYKRAVEILKTKRVDLNALVVSLALNKDCNYYNNERCFGNKITQREYNLLKEVFK